MADAAVNTTGQADRQAILKKLGGMRALPDAERGTATRRVALEIRALPASPDRVDLATGLANLATELVQCAAANVHGYPERRRGKYNEPSAQITMRNGAA
ncbi:MAG: hypothetical protein NT029_20665 [Armatimonadetes bacterium]|nr:hypothetical protein [Armatimonadota bacterium]